MTEQMLLILTLKLDLRTLYIVFKVAGDVEVRAHRGILAARSSVFKAMFEKNSAEGSTCREVVEDVSPELLVNKQCICLQYRSFFKLINVRGRP